VLVGRLAFCIIGFIVDDELYQLFLDKLLGYFELQGRFLLSLHNEERSCS
jgi:hypothetical protein